MFLVVTLALLSVLPWVSLSRLCFSCRVLLAVPGLLRCCVWVPIQSVGARLFGQGGAQVLEEVFAGPPRGPPRPCGGRVGEIRLPPRPIPRYGPPPGSLPVPFFASDSGRPTTSRAARSLLEGRLLERPGQEGQALQLALGELNLAMRRAEVSWLVAKFGVWCSSLGVRSNLVE